MGILDNIKKLFSATKNHSPAGQAPKSAAWSREYYVNGVEMERAQKDHYLRQDPYSPIADRMNFAGLNYYPPDPAYRLILPLKPIEPPELLLLQTNTGDEQPFNRIGTVEFEIEGQPAQLTVYQSAEDEALFIPFRDATSGKETYGAGRYLEPHDLGGGDLIVDFNRAYNPYCAYSADFSCPLPPFENHLKATIRAGEKIYPSN